MFPIGLLLLLCSASSGFRFSRNSDGTFSTVQEGAAGNDETPGTSEKLGRKLGSDVGAKTPFEYERKLVKPSGADDESNQEAIEVGHSPLDDEDLALVEKYINDVNINRTEQLKYNAVKNVINSLYLEFEKLIMSKKTYRLLLNNPDKKLMHGMFREMIREPMQEVIQQLILSKVLFAQAYYEKNYKPMSSPKVKEEVLDMLNGLIDRYHKKNLDETHTVDFEAIIPRLAYLIQDSEVNFKLNKLRELYAPTSQEMPDRDYSLFSDLADLAEEGHKKKIRKSAGIVTMPFSNSTQAPSSTSTVSSVSTASTTTQASSSTAFTASTNITSTVLQTNPSTTTPTTVASNITESVELPVKNGEILSAFVASDNSYV